MRVWGTQIASAAAMAALAVIVASTAAPGTALAQPSDVVREVSPADSPPAPPTGYGALPGGLRVASAERLPAGTIGVGVLSGYGYRSRLLGPDHTLGRAIGDLALAFAPLDGLAIALSFDGRYDNHSEGMTEDDSYVGDPHLLVRYASPVGAAGKLSLGGQLGVWAPGKSAPSIVGAAISFEARALLSIDLGFGVLAANAGFRIDNSAESLPHQRQDLSNADLVSLGVSDFSAVRAGASLRVPVNRRAYVALEGSTDVFVGDGALGPIVRGTGMAGVALAEWITLIGFVETARVPTVRGIAMAGDKVPLIPYEPTVTGGIGLQARFGGPEPPPPPPPPDLGPGTGQPIEVPILADVSGVVFDEAGKPVVGAKVTVKLKGKAGSNVTDGKGVYTVGRLPIGKTIDGRTELDDAAAEISVEVAGKKPATVTANLEKGSNPVPPITLDPMLPPGQLRGGVVNAGNGRPIAGATITIEPGELTITSGADGKFTVDLPPGRYKITVTARGMSQQQLDVIIEENGVAIKNIELRK